MWNKFTQQAQRAVYFAQVAAKKKQTNFVDVEHLLLGVLQEPENSACQLLQRLSVSPTHLYGELFALLPLGLGQTKADMSLTKRGKTSIDLAYQEAQILRNNNLDCEHLLLGVLREGNGLAEQVLSQCNVGLEQARQAVVLQQHTKPYPKTRDLLFRMFSRPAMKEPPSEP